MGPEGAWVYPYAQDLTLGAKEQAARMGRVPLQPIVPIELIGPTGRQRTVGLVDSGSEHTLIAPWLARATGAQATPEDPETRNRDRRPHPHYPHHACQSRPDPPARDGSRPLRLGG